MLSTTFVNYLRTATEMLVTVQFCMADGTFSAKIKHESESEFLFLFRQMTWFEYLVITNEFMSHKKDTYLLTNNI